MTREARETLPELLDAIGLRRGVLLGHSDGASIAAIYAGSVEDFRVRGLVLMAPHFFTEASGLAAIIGGARTPTSTATCGRSFGAYHRDVDAAFRGWNDAWLIPASRLEYRRRHRLLAHSRACDSGRRRSIRHARANPRNRATRLFAGRRRDPRRLQALSRISSSRRRRWRRSRISARGSMSGVEKATVDAR